MVTVYSCVIVQIGNATPPPGSIFLSTCFSAVNSLGWLCSLEEPGYSWQKKATKGRPLKGITSPPLQPYFLLASPPECGRPPSLSHCHILNHSALMSPLWWMSAPWNCEPNGKVLLHVASNGYFGQWKSSQYRLLGEWVIYSVFCDLIILKEAS